MLKNKLKTHIPVVEYYEPNFLVYKKIRGVELTHEIYHQLNQKQKNKLAYDIAYFLYEFHNSLNIKEVQELGLTNTGWPWPPEKLEKEALYLKDSDLTNLFIPFIQQYKESYQKNRESKLIHNDMILRNIIVNEESGLLQGIIDFTDAALDDPYFDLRLNYMSIPELSETIAQNYAALANINLKINIIYIYYMATEYSRYLEYTIDQKLDELEKIKSRIIHTFEFLNN